MLSRNDTEARLYIARKHDELDYYIKKIKSFLVTKFEPSAYIKTKPLA
jgi:hypothetical protein